MRTPISFYFTTAIAGGAALWCLAVFSYMVASLVLPLVLTLVPYVLGLGAIGATLIAPFFAIAMAKGDDRFDKNLGRGGLGYVKPTIQAKVSQDILVLGGITVASGFEAIWEYASQELPLQREAGKVYGRLWATLGLDAEPDQEEALEFMDLLEPEPVHVPTHAVDAAALSTHMVEFYRLRAQRAEGRVRDLEILVAKMASRASYAKEEGVLS